jgi:single-strand DNA-binding protein
MLNHAAFMGRLTRDPELKKTPSGVSVTSFTIAVDRDFDKEKTDFFDCVAWSNTAEYICKYFAKGRMIAVSGRMQVRDWMDKDGNKRKAVELVADKAYFADSKKETNNNNADFYDNEDDADFPF